MFSYSLLLLYVTTLAALLSAQSTRPYSNDRSTGRQGASREGRMAGTDPGDRR